MNATTSCAVVGAGLVGICTALELQHRGCQVTLIDRDEPGRGASFGNAGFIASELIDPLATRATLKKALPMMWRRHGALAVPWKHLHHSVPWMLRFAYSTRAEAVNRGRVALAQLLKAAVPAWGDLLSREGLTSHLRPTHYLRVWETPRGEEAALAEQRFYDEWGIEAFFADGRQVADIEPALAGQVHHGVVLPHAHRLSDPFELSQCLLTRFRCKGGRVVRADVSSLRPFNEGVQLTFSGSPHTFDKAIVCAGAYSARLLKPLNFDIPLMAERGYHLNLSTVRTLIRGPVCSAERNVFISPLDGGLRIVGFSELGGLDLPAVPARYETLKHHLGALLPQTLAHLGSATEWMGRRPTLPDSLPVIDTLPGAPQIGVAFGHQHAGVTLAAITSTLIADRLLKQAERLDLAAYTLARF